MSRTINKEIFSLALPSILRPAGNAQVHLLFVAYYAHLVWRSVYQTVKYKPAVLRRLS